MEYIREMLLRQRTALARLMLGGAAEEPSETASAQAADRRRPLLRRMRERLICWKAERAGERQPPADGKTPAGQAGSRL